MPLAVRDMIVTLVVDNVSATQIFWCDKQTAGDDSIVVSDQVNRGDQEAIPNQAK